MSVLPDDNDPAESVANARVVRDAIAGGVASAVAHGATPPGPRRTLEDQRIERSRRLKLSVILSLAIKPLAFVIPIITVPLFLKYLGTEGFGLFAVVGALAMWIGLANGGLNVGLINQLTEASITDDRKAARLYVSTLTIAMIVMFVVGTATFGAIVWAIDWHRIFPTKDPAMARQVPLAVFLAGEFTLLGMLTGIPAAIYAGYQEMHRAVIWDGVSKVLTLLACLLVVFLPKSWSLLLVLLATSGVGSLVRLVNTVDLFTREKPFLAPSPALFDWHALGTMLKHGVNLFILSMAVIALFQSDKLIIGKFVGPAAVTPYELLGRVFLSVHGVFSLFIQPLWPAYGDAVRRGDWDWVKRQLNRTRTFGVGAITVAGLVMLVWGSKVIRIWSGEPIDISKSLVLAITAMFIVRVWAESQSIALNAANVLVPQVILFGGHAVLNIIVALCVARRFGTEGIVWSTSITGVFTSVWGYPWLVRRYLFGKHGQSLIVRTETTSTDATATPAATCPVCNSRDCEDQGPPAYRLPTRVAGVSIDLSDVPVRHLLCRACSYRFVYPQIPEERLLDCYARAPQSHWGTDAHVAEDRTYDRKRALLEEFSPGRRALDFGCFDGGFLEYLGPSWEKLGIEPSTTAAKMAESRGVRVLSSTIDELMAKHPTLEPPPDFIADAIIIFDVMEHLNDPVGTLRKLSNYLRPGGVILIETGDTDAPQFAKLGKLYPYCQFVDHVGFFNRKSIARAGEVAAGLQLRSFERSIHSKALVSNLWAARMHNLKYSVIRLLHRTGIPLGAWLTNIATGPLPRSTERYNHFIAVLQKPQSTT